MGTLRDDLLPDARSAADYIGTDKRTVYELVRKGAIPAVRMGRKLYFRKSEINLAFSSQPTAANDGAGR